MVNDALLLQQAVVEVTHLLKGQKVTVSFIAQNERRMLTNSQRVNAVLA